LAVLSPIFYRYFSLALGRDSIERAADKPDVGYGPNGAQNPSSATSSQNRPKHRDSIIPESARHWPFGDHFGRHLVGSGQVGILAEAHFGRENAIAEQNVVLVVQIKAAPIHVGRPN